MTRSNLQQLIFEGEWEKLKHNPEYQSLPTEKKILIAQKTVNNKLSDIDSIFWETVKTDTKSAGIIMDKRIKPLRTLIKALNARYAGALDEDEEEQLNRLLALNPPDV